MNFTNELPTGFGMALVQNQEAARFFDGCTQEQKQAILNQIHNIHSKQEMQAFVAHLPSATL